VDFVDAAESDTECWHGEDQILPMRTAARECGKQLRAANLAATFASPARSSLNHRARCSCRNLRASDLGGLGRPRRILYVVRPPNPTGPRVNALVLMPTGAESSENHHKSRQAL
jgi:hypothetical protein